jgi:hypothetical protein
MGAPKIQLNADDTVGRQLAPVLPADGRPWYRQAHLLKLNFSILSLMLFGKFHADHGV